MKTNYMSSITQNDSSKEFRTSHPYFCFLCGKQLYEAGLGILVCDTGHNMIPFESDGYQCVQSSEKSKTNENNNCAK